MIESKDKRETMQEGDVVITCMTGQAGTIVQLGSKIWVLLRNDCLWYGTENQLRFPQDQADLDSCPVDFDRFIGR